MSGHPPDVEETALRQVERLGHSRQDVRHIALTRFHFDHAGGLPDFPWAKVHIFQGEHQAVTQPRDLHERHVYRREHGAHGPQWAVHGLAGDRWFGFECTPPIRVGALEVRLVPLPGHTRGHCGVALRLADGWLFHCGDAYTFHGDVDPVEPFPPPYQRVFRPFFNISGAMRAIGRHSPRLRALRRAHGDEVRLTCSHDPHELEKFLGGKGEGTGG